jgi:signal transduction histidine kinase
MDWKRFGCVRISVRRESEIHTKRASGAALNLWVHAPGGTDMGLSISRRIIESHGGRLWASANTGRGATFQFTLPGSPQSV